MGWVIGSLPSCRWEWSVFLSLGTTLPSMPAAHCGSFPTALPYYDWHLSKLKYPVPYTGISCLPSTTIEMKEYKEGPCWFRKLLVVGSLQASRKEWIGHALLILDHGERRWHFSFFLALFFLEELDQEIWNPSNESTSPHIGNQRRSA